MDKDKIELILRRNNIEDENLANALAEIAQEILKRIPSTEDLSQDLAALTERQQREGCNNHVKTGLIGLVFF